MNGSKGNPRGRVALLKTGMQDERKMRFCDLLIEDTARKYIKEKHIAGISRGIELFVHFIFIHTAKPGCIGKSGESIEIKERTSGDDRKEHHEHHGSKTRLRRKLVEGIAQQIEKRIYRRAMKLRSAEL